jgi:hypothetical protein
VANSGDLGLLDIDIIEESSAVNPCLRTFTSEATTFEYEVDGDLETFNFEHDYHEGGQSCGLSSVTYSVVDQDSVVIDGSSTPVSWDGTDFSI